MKPISQCRLYGFVDTTYLAGRSPAELARQLCEGGADLIQLRAKECSPDEIRCLARTLVPITSAAGVWLVVNDYASIARETRAPAVHLGQEDFFDKGHQHVAEFKPPDSLLSIGLSTHAPDQAERAVAAGADYIAIGPVFATATKPGALPVTLEFVRWASAHVRIPWFAIGGINLENLDAVIAAGARRVCVVAALLKAPDVVRACHAFKERLLSAPLSPENGR